MVTATELAWVTTTDADANLDGSATEVAVTVRVGETGTVAGAV